MGAEEAGLRESSREGGVESEGEGRRRKVREGRGGGE